MFIWGGWYWNTGNTAPQKKSALPALFLFVWAHGVLPPQSFYQGIFFVWVCLPTAKETLVLMSEIVDRLLFAVNRMHIWFMRVSCSQTIFTITSVSSAERKVPESSAVMALDVRGEQSICECILDHTVDHRGLALCRWTGKNIRQLIRFLRCDFKWWKSQITYFSKKALGLKMCICCFHLESWI